MPRLTYFSKALNVLITLTLPFQKTSGESIEQLRDESLAEEPRRSVRSRSVSRRLDSLSFFEAMEQASAFDRWLAPRLVDGDHCPRE